MNSFEILTGLSLVLFLGFWLWLRAMMWRVIERVQSLERRIERLERRFVPPGF